MIRKTHLTFALTALLTGPASLLADVSVPAIFSDHAVLQNAASVPVWGKADPGEKVTVSWGTAKAEAVAGSDGKWRVNLNVENAAKSPGTKASAGGPQELIVEGRNRIVAKDVVAGEVWLCAGQSNMGLPLKKTMDAAREIAASSNPRLRQFLVAQNASPTPLDTLEGKWVLAELGTSGDFTALGYYFGKRLQQALNVPVGLVNASWGGSICEAWTSLSALEQDPDLKAAAKTLLQAEAELPDRIRNYAGKFEAWVAAHGRADHPSAQAADYAAPSASMDGWKKVKLPGKLADAGLPDAGAIWVRRTIQVPPDLANQKIYAELGIVNGFETVYWNGQKVGEFTVNSPGLENSRRYLIPAALMKEGGNTIAIRIFNPVGGAGISPAVEFGLSTIPFKGDWLAKAEFALPALAPEDKASCPVGPDAIPEPRKMPAHLFNGMIHPLIPCAMRGVIWYQGESNTSSAHQYRTTFPLMIKDWRSRWTEGDFPFYFCQLPNFKEKKVQPGESAWAELRDAQTSALDLPNTGQAILIDIGEEGDLHPPNKKDAGERLARIALARTYGQNVAWSGPVFDSMTAKDGKVHIRFQHAAGGLVARPLPETYPLKTSSSKMIPLVRNSPQSELEGFAVCGEDRQWKWADAKIEGDSVSVWSPQVPTPVAVRYAWADNPTCNLYNGNGLPAAPFRTDDFPGLTHGNKYGQPPKKK